ncbi:hypothetical protein [Terracidiphilus gabretensis]|uniref:hypothetical protein n=1 Tax=Terracidiphilus gabretensis TaxID=1577687 RepID=UPI0012F74581|nr:hypothetical protein [Terracidiphilus gabretensis]
MSSEAVRERPAREGPRGPEGTRASAATKEHGASLARRSRAGRNERATRAGELDARPCAEWAARERGLRSTQKGAPPSKGLVYL